MASHPHHHSNHNPIHNFSSFMQFTASKTFLPLPFVGSPPQLSSSSESAQADSPSSLKGMPSSSGSGFPSTVRISRLSSAGNGGPAFVGQVFSMCDLSGTGLMAVSTHFDIPFISKRTPEWLKKIFSAVTKSERNGPVFRFFFDLGDAVSYVKRLNIPSGVVGACRLDLAYEHFKEKPHLFQFVPNEKQVKEANKLLKTMPQNGARKKVDGVPVFSSQNLDIAIATTDGIKWYTPYFFDKGMLDKILEESTDQHFHALIQTRNFQRRRDVIDDSLASEMIEETAESTWEPPEVQEVLDEMGHPAIPLSVISKAAEIQLLYAVDKVLLGNRWLRKATGIQPKFPYMVDSFERRTAASLLRASESSRTLANSESENTNHLQHHGISELTSTESIRPQQERGRSFRLPFRDWFMGLLSKRWQKPLSDERVEAASGEHMKQEVQQSPLLPKITMVGISTGDTGQMSKATLKKTMENLTRELEQTDQGNADGDGSNELRCEGFAILALSANSVHKLWKWQRNDRNLTAKATASVAPQLWHPSSGILMTNDISDTNPEDAVPCFALSKNDSYVMSASGGKISLFNMMTFKTMTTFMPPPPAATFLAFHPQDNNIIAIGMEDSTIQIYNVRVDEVKTKLKGHEKRITGLAFSNILNILVSSGADSQLCVWSTDGWEKQTSKYVQIPSGRTPTPLADTRVQFHQDQIHLLTTHETQIAIYEAPKLECVKQWVPREGNGSITHATYSCDSQSIYVSFEDGSVGVLTASTLRLRCRINRSSYLSANPSLRVYPLVVASHPSEPNQFALGLTDGGVCVLEPLEAEGKWGTSPPHENDAGPSTISGAANSDQPQR